MRIITLIIEMQDESKINRLRQLRKILKVVRRNLFKAIAKQGQTQFVKDRYGNPIGSYKLRYDINH